MEVGPVQHDDEVDRIVGAWERELPHVDVSPMQVLSRVSRLAHHLDQARKTAFAAHELDPWEFDVLSALRRSGAPYELSPGRLVAETFVTSGTMTNRIDRLTERGLVQRRPDPEDRRGVLVQITADGRSRVDAAVAELLQHESQILAGLSSSARERLTTDLRDLLRPFDA